MISRTNLMQVMQLQYSEWIRTDRWNVIESGKDSWTESNGKFC